MARSRAAKFIREVASVGAAALVVATARSSFADHYFVPSGSMLPTVHAGDRILVDKAAYDVRVPFTSFSVAKVAPPAHGDVVVLESPETSDTLLKRLVGLPGDLVEVKGGHLVLDGVPVPMNAGNIELLGRAHTLDLEYGGGPDFGPRRLAPDEYLVMGDNRGNSNDGRMFGFVHRSAIRGRAIAVYARDGVPMFSKL